LTAQSCATQHHLLGCTAQQRQGKRLASRALVRGAQGRYDASVLAVLRPPKGARRGAAAGDEEGEEEGEEGSAGVEFVVAYEGYAEHEQVRFAGVRRGRIKKAGESMLSATNGENGRGGWLVGVLSALVAACSPMLDGWRPLKCQPAYQPASQLLNSVPEVVSGAGRYLPTRHDPDPNPTRYGAGGGAWSRAVQLSVRSALPAIVLCRMYAWRPDTLRITHVTPCDAIDTDFAASGQAITCSTSHTSSPPARTQAHPCARFTSPAPHTRVSQSCRPSGWPALPS
jgi:hypothetical protein